MRLVQQTLSPVAVRIKSGGVSPDAQAAWRFMRDAGGWYTAAELAAELMPGVPPTEGARLASRWLVALTNRQHVAQKVAPRRKFSHGVTARCVPIPGESLEPADLS